MSDIFNFTITLEEGSGAIAEIAAKAEDAFPIRLLVKSPLWTIGEAKQLIEKLTEAVAVAEGDAQSTPVPAGFQDRVFDWVLACFGPEIAADKVERHHRFLEEALELVQATGCTQSEAQQLVEYVFSRSVGEPVQEVGGVMVTLAALCASHSFDMAANGETELARVWTKVEKIRAKQAAKPQFSPLPEAPQVTPKASQ